MKRSIFLVCFALLLGIGPLMARADQPSPNALLFSSNITTATTTQVLAAQPGPVLLYWVGIETSGTNSANTYQFEYSPNAACASSNTALVPVGQAVPTTSGFFNAQYGGAGGNSGSNSAAVFASPVPFVLPAANYLCIVTAGTTTALYAVVLYSH